MRSVSGCRGAPCLLLVVLTCLVVLGPATAPTAYGATVRSGGTPSDPCASQGLRTAEAEAALRLDHDDRTYTKVVSELTITVRPTGLGRGAIEIAWGDKLPTAPLTVGVQ